LCAIAELVLVLVRWRFREQLQRIALSATTVGLLSLLLAPTVWAAIPLVQEGRVFPMAGPPPEQAHIPANLADPALVNYLLARKGKKQFLLATMNTETAAPFIIDTGQPVMALGGYAGTNSFLTREQVIAQIDQGSVRFFLLPSSDDPAAIWVITRCKAVPTDQWQSSSSASFLMDELVLYDCAGHS
jgi:4-amino-4-deoxy-L-arabinose transferase-like glycosyltransferase